MTSPTQEVDVVHDTTVTHDSTAAHDTLTLHDTTFVTKEIAVHDSRVVHYTTVTHDTVALHDTVQMTSSVTIHDTTRQVQTVSQQSPLTLDGILALLGLLLAVFALAGATQRRSLFILLPMRRLLFWLGAAVFAVLLPDVLRMFGFEPSPLFAIGLPIAAFGIAVGVTAFGFIKWGRGAIPLKSVAALEELALASLNEGNFDEVGRLMRLNIQTLRSASEDALVALFDPKLVAAMVERRNYAHLELLGDENAFGTRHAALTGIDVVAHALLHADPSPIASVIVKALGGDERHAALTSEKALAERTYGNWRWYTASRSAQIVAVIGYEALMTGRYDTAYNLADSHYQTPNGTSGRIKCPAYRAIALHYLALEKAQRYGVIDGADPNDFFSVFKAAYARSRVSKAWDSPLKDAPTPFAYLMHETLRSLQLLARDCYAHAMGDSSFRDEHECDIPVPPQAEGVFKRTCENWALCLWFLTTEANHVPDKFIVEGISQYMNEALQFGFEQGAEPRRTHYAEVAVDAFQHHLQEDHLIQLTREAIDSLDHGKRYVSNGRAWLRTRLGI